MYAVRLTMISASCLIYNVLTKPIDCDIIAVSSILVAVALAMHHIVPTSSTPNMDDLRTGTVFYMISITLLEWLVGDL